MPAGVEDESVLKPEELNPSPSKKRKLEEVKTNSPNQNNSEESKGELLTKESTPSEKKNGEDEETKSFGSESKCNNEEESSSYYSLENLPSELTKMFKPLECELCKVKVESNIVALTHYKGRTHKKKINSYLQEKYKDKLAVSEPKKKLAQQMICEVCDLILTSEIVAQQHFAGKPHQRKEKSEKAINFVRVPKAKFDPTGRFGIGETFVPPKVNQEEISVTKQGYFCSLCNVGPTTLDQLEAHKKGTKHLRKLKKEPGENSSYKDLAMYRTPSDSYYCPKCNVNANAPEPFIQHLESRKHMKNLKNKDNTQPDTVS